jgi:hypothetical protein
VLERHHQPGTVPKLNAVLTDKASGLLGCASVVRRYQRLIPKEVSVVSDEVSAVFFHPESPLPDES